MFGTATTAATAHASQCLCPILTWEFPCYKVHLQRRNWTNFLVSLVWNKKFINKSKRQQKHEKTSKA